MQKFKVNGVVTVRYSINTELYLKLLDIYDNYPPFRSVLKTSIDMFAKEQNEELEDSIETHYGDKGKNLTNSFSHNNVANTFPANYMERKVVFDDYEMTYYGTESKLENIQKELERNIEFVFDRFLSIPKARIDSKEICITYLEELD